MSLLTSSLAYTLQQKSLSLTCHVSAKSLKNVIRSIVAIVSQRFHIRINHNSGHSQSASLLAHKRRHFGGTQDRTKIDFHISTTKISVMGNLLDVSVYEYVDKEEHDTKLLFSGKLLKEYHVNKDTGEIEEIQ